MYTFDDLNPNQVWYVWESVSPGCGLLGIEILPLLAWGARRRMRRR